MKFPYKIRWQFVGSIDGIILFDVTASSVVISQMLELICICSHYTGRSLPHISISIPPTNDHFIVKISLRWKTQLWIRWFFSQACELAATSPHSLQNPKGSTGRRCRGVNAVFGESRCGFTRGWNEGIFVKYLVWRFFFLKNARFWKYWNTWHHLDVELVEQQTSTATHQQDTVTATLYRTIKWWNMWEHIALSRVFLPVFIPQLEADNLTRDQNSVKQWGRVHRSKRWLPGD